MTVSKWENNVQRPRFRRLEQMATLYGVALGQLMPADQLAKVRDEDGADVESDAQSDRVRESYTYVPDPMRHLPNAARDLMRNFESRMERASLPDEAVARFKWSILDRIVGQWFAEGRPLRTEQDWIKAVNAEWAIVSDIIRRGGREP